MSGGFGDAETRPTQSSSFSTNNDSNNGDAGNFECSICFDLAQDPIITLCGHLFCWPCLYKWLHIHSHCQECPVCKAHIEEEKLVPLYGRGKNSTDPRCKSVPNRPSGQRPETAHRVDRNVFGLGGFGPSMTATFGNFTFSLGGFVPSIFNIQMHGFNGVPMYGNGYSYGANQYNRGDHHEIGYSVASPLLIIGLLFLWALVSN